jgi:hypothetical protein
MIHLGVTDFIPEQYLLPRWKNPEDVIVAVKVEVPGEPKGKKLTNKEKKLIRYGNLCNDWTDIAKVASAYEKTKALAEKYMNALSNELKALKISEASKRKSKKKTGETTPNEGETTGGPSDTQGETTGGPSATQGQTAGGPSATEGDTVAGPNIGSASQHENVRDPPQTTTKGRPGEKRKKSGLGLKSTKPIKCSVCGSTSHNAANCPDKITPESNPSIFDFMRDMV